MRRRRRRRRRRTADLGCFGGCRTAAFELAERESEVDRRTLGGKELESVRRRKTNGNRRNSWLEDEGGRK
jgi:hypothetical protein